MESWICEACDHLIEKRSEESKPTEQLMVIKRLLKLSTDYEQIRGSALTVEGDRVNPSLRMYPWEIRQSRPRVEKAKET